MRTYGELALYANERNEERVRGSCNSRFERDRRRCRITRPIQELDVGLVVLVAGRDCRVGEAVVQIPFER